MKSRAWLILTAGFGTLILLIGLLGFGAMRREKELHDETAAAHAAYLQNDAILREIPADLYLSDVLIRDYLLDPSHLTAPFYREQLLTRRSSIRHRLDLLAQRLGGDEAARLQELRNELRAYWESMDPIMKWSPQQKAAFGHVFLRQQVLPRRDAVVDLAREISEINTANLEREQHRLDRGQGEFMSFLSRTVASALALGIVVALISTLRAAALESHSEQQRLRAEHAEQELRRLSRKLVRTQEEERRSLSRELHDAIGQMLSGMTMELGNLEALAGSKSGKFTERINEARRLNADTIRSVRDLAMGLRPSMLDELGLGPALRWQGREFTHRSGVPVTVQLDGNVEEIPDSHRTCIYRIVQEALTNCAKHAHASSIRISVFGRGNYVGLSIQDDGVGFDPREASSRGLGLIGIEERVMELEGAVSIISQPRKGSLLKVELPVKVTGSEG